MLYLVLISNPKQFITYLIFNTVFNEIELLESIVQDYLCGYPPKKDEALESMEIESIINRIKKALVRSVFEIKKDRQFQFYIHDIQRRLVYLSNNIYTHSVTILTPDTQEIDTTARLQSQVDKLLIYLEDNFSKQVNPQLLIPNKLLDEAAIDFNIQINQIEFSIQEQEAELLEIVLSPIKDFIITKQPISYHQFSYYKLLTWSLVHFNKGSFKEYLIELNFNSYSFFNFLKNDIEKSLNDLETWPEKIEKLLWNLKWIKHFHLKETAYNINRKSIKDLLSDWIIEELNYHEKSGILEKLASLEIKAPNSKDFKLITDLSVPQLGFLLRVFIDSGLFKNENDKALAKFFAQYTVTKGSSTLSPSNLLNKFYNLSGDVEEDVKGIIIKMLNQIHNY